MHNDGTYFGINRRKLVDLVELNEELMPIIGESKLCYSIIRLAVSRLGQHRSNTAGYEK